MSEHEPSELPLEGIDEEATEPLTDLPPEDLRKTTPKAAETARRKRVMPYIVTEYLAGVPMDDIIDKYDIPEGSIHYYFQQLGVKRTRTDAKKSRAKKGDIQKEIRQIETRELSLEAEKIATIAIGIGGPIARRYLPLIDTMMSEGMSLEYIAEQVMSWYELKISILAQIARLETDVELRKQEAMAAISMSMPNFRYWLRVKVVEKYANQLLRARMYGVKIPMKVAMKALNTDLLMVDQDIEKVMVGV